MQTILNDEVPLSNMSTNSKKSDIIERELSLSKNQKAVLPEEIRPVFPFDTTVKTGKLKNGLSYFLKNFPGAGNIAKCYLVVKAGSAMEADNQIGAALSLKYLVMNETEDLMESFPMFASQDISFDDSFQEVVRDFSGFEETIYEYVTFISGSQKLVSAFSILKTWASGAVLDPADFEKEKLNVFKFRPLNYGINSILQSKTVFAGTRYGDRIPTDLSASLKALKPDAIKKFYNYWYRPDLMAVIIVGNIDVVEAEKEIKKVFSNIKKPEIVIKNSPSFFVNNKEMKTYIKTDDQASTTKVQILFKNQKRPVRDLLGYRQLIMNEMINVMIQERFSTTEFIQRGNSVSGFFRPSGNTEFLFVTLDCKKGKFQDDLKLTLIEIENLRKVGFTESELEKAKIYIKKKVEEKYTNETLIDVMSQKMIWHYLDGEPLLDVQQQQEMLKNFLPDIRLNEINKTLTQLTKEENSFILINGPSDAIGNLSEHEQIKKMVEEVKNK